MDYFTAFKDTQKTANRIMKVNHAGEYGAINIYTAQTFICRFLHKQYATVLSEFREHEKRHHAIFAEVMNNRSISRCRSYWLCGVGGFCLGIVTALLGKKAIMACTTAVESVVLKHLYKQLEFLDKIEDKKAYAAVQSIIKDEEEHCHTGAEAVGDSILHRPIKWFVEFCTKIIIWLGMKL